MNSLIGAVAVLAVASNAAPGVPKTVLERAAEGIEAHRKADGLIRLVREDGTPAGGAKVDLRQVSHAFPFGNLFRPRHYDDTVYRARFLEIFNFIELLEFNWGQYEPDEGKPLLEERLRFIRDWARPNGIDRFYGHMLVWSSQYGAYPKTALPLWLFRYDGAKQRELLAERIRREVRAYRDIDILWDVVNEATHCRRWGDWRKPSYIDEPLEAIVPYVADALAWARGADPEAKVLINDYRVIFDSPYRKRFLALLEALRERKAPLSAVGIQAHEPYKGAYWYAPEELWQTYDLFGTKLGLPIYITEFFYVSDPQKDIRGAHRSGRWSPERQAEAIEEFYRTSFGHPAVAAIVYFGMFDDDVVIPTLGLFDASHAPKPAWERLRRLIREEWMTRASGAAAGDGTFRFRGFLGRYDVRATVGGKEKTFRIDLEKGKENEWRFLVP
ncbi:MAG: endo-1,4-beta-xylanase [Planctomycetes bacterium]|nr:endo-1,4-beta-xylanase [Planctomycetota bacterium]